jgi:hypothetical protein
MRIIALVAFVLLAAAPAFGQVQQRNGYVRRDGAYVPPSYSTRPDSSPFNNFSTRGNVNPYSGRQGTVDPYRPPSPPSFGTTTRRSRDW